VVRLSRAYIKGDRRVTLVLLRDEVAAELKFTDDTLHEHREGISTFLGCRDHHDLEVRVSQ
jgi:hypothetical protein